MAQKVQVVLIDDIDGEDADETLQFALDGVSYEIDLSEVNADALRAVLGPYVLAARRVGGRVTRRPAGARPARPASRRADLSDVRAWARDNGFEVSDRGRVSQAVKEACEAAHA